ncbi:hypothetical protein K449DRAFT_469884 [Hypoxylon sp. EC38]|nr:hypothetical protein K449DRAFT_469884 [Hypoxylon sp. EC38]
MSCAVHTKYVAQSGLVFSGDGDNPCTPSPAKLSGVWDRAGRPDHLKGHCLEYSARPSSLN